MTKAEVYNKERAKGVGKASLAVIEVIIAKYERKLKKEYNRGFDDGVEAEAKVKKGTKRLCSECKKKLMG